MIIIGLVMCLVLQFAHLDSVYGKHNRLYDQYDPLFVARCEARCWNIKNKNKCTKMCLMKDIEKPGYCPNSEALSPFSAVCLKACNMDSQCPSIYKCCKHQCGVTCQFPKDLELEKDVPEIPKNVTISERRRKRTIQIKWLSPNPSTHVVLYVIEQRFYFGQHFIENRMGEWTVCVRTLKPSAVLKRFVKPGRWYQFRVAAVNENGTKGFSKKSDHFISIFDDFEDPRPPKSPQNLTAGPLLYGNGSLSTELRWKSPNSDLPIDKYKVFWSKRLHGASALDSVLVQQKIISKDQTKFYLQNLEPNSLYFLQIQALSQYGKNRLKGEKSGLLLNTSNYVYVNESDNLTNSNFSTIENLFLQKLWFQKELRARITWKSKNGVQWYVLSWTSGSCGSYNEPLNTSLDATTKQNYFDLYDLKFKCRYKVTVRCVFLNDVLSAQASSIVFSTPSCNYFKIQHQDLIC